MSHAAPPPVSSTSARDEDRLVADIEALLHENATGKRTDTPTSAGLRPLDLEAEIKALERDDVDHTSARQQINWQDDWTETQWPYVRMLMDRCRRVVALTTAKNTRHSLIRWCFAGAVPKTSLRATFNQCCYELRVRPYVLQAMVHHQWYRHGLLLDAPLPHMSDMVHEGILGEAAMHSFDAGSDAAVAVWNHPSRYLREVIADVSAMGHTEDEADTAIASLVEAGLLGARNGRLWFTGRSPEFLANRRTSFARSFIEPQDPPVASEWDTLTSEEQALLFGADDDAD